MNPNNIINGYFQLPTMNSEIAHKFGYCLTQLALCGQNHRPNSVNLVQRTVWAGLIHGLIQTVDQIFSFPEASVAAKVFVVYRFKLSIVTMKKVVTMKGFP
ncbi:hypothetical protein Fot_33553 [Forsythia ovata]|uniref:Uncharacterized protein n=1 Tax=Forsythia ovata TaxID=205694 RepID=A0ABD1TB65_9LAMI